MHYFPFSIDVVQCSTILHILKPRGSETRRFVEAATLGALSLEVTVSRSSSNAKDDGTLYSSLYILSSRKLVFFPSLLTVGKVFLARVGDEMVYYMNVTAMWLLRRGVSPDREHISRIITDVESSYKTV